MRSVFDEIHLAALQGAYILKPDIEDGVRKHIKEDMEPALNRFLGDVSINVKGGPAKLLARQENERDDPEAKACHRSAAHLLMIRYGASPVYVAESACDEYAAFLRTNYGVIAHNRDLATLDLDDIELIMTTLSDMSIEGLRQLAYQAAFHGYTGFVYQLSFQYPEALSYSHLAANAAAGSHYRFAEKLWGEQSLKIAPIVQAALKTTDFVNPVIALFHLSFMGDAFRTTFANQLKSQHPAYNIDKLSAIATNIHRFIQEGFHYEEALLLGISHTKGESLSAYAQAETAAARGTDLFKHSYVFNLYKKQLELGNYERALTLMRQYSECPGANISTFLKLTKDIGSCNTILHLLADPSHQHLLPIIKQIQLPAALFLKDLINAQGQTPLECAARNGHAEFCKFLIDNGAPLTSPILLEEQGHANSHAEEQKAQPPQYGLLIDVAKGPAKQVLLDAYLSDAHVDSRFEAAPFQPLIDFRRKNPAPSFKPFLFFGIGGQQDRELKFANYAMKTIMIVVDRHRHESITILSTQLQQTLKYLQRLALENKLIIQDKPSPFSKALDEFCKNVVKNPECLLEGNPLGNMPYHYFAAAGNLEALRGIDIKSHINSPNKAGQTLLHIAAEHGRGDVCQHLITHGASLTAQMPDGRLSIEIATGSARQVLLNAYDEAPRPAPLSTDSPGVLIVYHQWADAEPKKEIRIAQKLPDNYQQLHHFFADHPFTAEGNFAWQAISIMHQVIYHQECNTHTINAALKHLDIVATATKVFEIPLLFSDSTKDLIVAFELFRYQLQSIPWHSKAKKGSAAAVDSVIHITETPLHKFIQMGNNDLLERVLRQKIIDINEVDKDFNTPLHLAAQKDNLKACKLLVAYKADLFLENITEEKTALAMAGQRVKRYLSTIISQSSEMVRELQDRHVSYASAAVDNPRFFSVETDPKNMLTIPSVDKFEEVDLDPDGPSLFD